MNPAEFPRRLKLMLGEHDKSQTRLSAETGIAYIQINHYCTGRRYPNFENLLLILGAFDDPHTRSYLVGI